MAKRFILVSIIILSLLISLVLPASISAEPTNGSPARLIVTFDESSRQAVKDFAKNKGGQVLRDFSIIPGIVILLGSEQIPGLMSVKGVKQVGIDGKVHASDAELDNSWGVKRIEAGNVSLYNKGEGVKVGIIDTGIDYSHPELSANYMGGYDFVNKDTDPMDDNGHGTHVAGIVAALDDNTISNVVVGVAPEAQLYSYKALDSAGSGYWSDIIAALEMAIEDDVKVINMSLGSKSDATGLHEAIIAAYNSGIVIVAAAGNSGNPSGKTDSIEYPARYEEVIAVGATDRNDVRASFSSTGELLELAAPGVGILSTVPGGYASYSGTSMASPHVAGTAALIIASGVTTNTVVRQKLQNTADDLGAIGRDRQYGYGIINAYKAVPPDLATGSIRGIVTNATNPIEGASVTDGTRTVISDSSGNYEINNVPDGIYTVTASAENYNSGSLQGVTVSSGGVTSGADIVLTLISHGTISGKVVIAGTVEPISGAIISNGTNASVATDAYGVYTIPDVAPGTYTVTASAENYNSGTLQGIVVLSGETTTADFALSPAAAAKMHIENIYMEFAASGPNYFIYTKVTVLDSDNKPVSAATVYIKTELPDSSEVFTSGQTDTAGIATLKFKSKQTGEYISKVIDVSKAGWTYDNTAIMTFTLPVP